MASIEFITKRIEGKKKEIAKLEKKLERINKAAASNWEDNPYYYTTHDLKWTTRDLEAAKAALEKYQADLTTETEKDNSRNVEAIISFLDAWADRVFKMYSDNYTVYKTKKAEYYKKEEAYCEWHNHGGWKDPDRKQIEAEWRKTRDTFKRKWSWMAPYDTTNGFDAAKLTKELEQDKKAKYDDIINRANAICGTIKDAGNLSVGEKGELNGLVIGERANARINTIGAGGYNIQCYHFRTLIHKA